MDCPEVSAVRRSTVSTDLVIRDSTKVECKIRAVHLAH